MRDVYDGVEFKVRGVVVAELTGDDDKCSVEKGGEHKGTLEAEEPVGLPIEEAVAHKKPFRAGQPHRQPRESRLARFAGLALRDQKRSLGSIQGTFRGPRSTPLPPLPFRRAIRCRGGL